jgi:hypothetical protein
MAGGSRRLSWQSDECCDKDDKLVAMTTLAQAEHLQAQIQVIIESEDYGRSFLIA